MELPPHVRLGLLRDGLGARIIPGTGGLEPSAVGLDGDRALARYLFARNLAGHSYDAKTQEQIFHLDEALSSPWTMMGEQVMRLLQPSGLNIRIDAARVTALEDDAARARATFPRWRRHKTVPSRWVHTPGTIDPVHKAEVAAALRELGWRKYGGKQPELSDPDATPGNSVFSFAYDSICECGTKRDNLLAWAGGSSKSRSSIMLADYYRHMGTQAPTIILGLKRHLRQTWIDDEMPQLELLQKRYGADVYWETWLEKGDEPSFNAPFLLVSLERLKMLSDAQMEHLQKIAKESPILVDELYVASNHDTHLYKALSKIQGKHHIGLSGTPFRGRITGAHATLSWVFRPGSVAFPDYRVDRQGGRKAFEDDFVTWAVDDSGGRKTVPILKTPNKFDAITANTISRRVRDEPEVESVLGTAIVETKYIDVPWEPAHRAFYEIVLSQFKEWYIRTKEAQGEAGILFNEALVKLGFVVRAMAQPWAMKSPPPDEVEKDDGKFKWEFPEFPMQLTGIMAHALEEARRQVEAGKQVIVASRHVQQLDLLAKYLDPYNPVVSHGGYKLEDRSKGLLEFRSGRSAILLGSYGTIAESLNLPMAKFCIPMEATWDADSIKQTEWRMTRGVVSEVPVSHRLTTAGSIYEYQTRWAALKSSMSAAALDGEEQLTTSKDIMDIGAFIASIVDDFTEQRKYTLVS